MKALMVKTSAGHLAPLNEEEAEHLKPLKLGHVLEVTIVRKRNPAFHRKFFALIATAYDAWSEMAPRVEYQGIPVQPNRERLRKDLIVLAGFYEPVFNLKGELRLEPMSISFSSMSEEDFEALYSAVIQVVLDRILAARGYDEKTLRAHVDRVLAFD